MNTQNSDCWKNEGAQKVFTHPVHEEWLKDVDRRASILDFGCGYGRLTPNLREQGFTVINGYDLSAPLIKRAIQENPGAIYTSKIDQLFEGNYDLVLCFALFTSCPTADEQSKLISLINGFTKKGTLLYISDYVIDDNPHYFERYEQRQLDIYGCFQSGTADFRHHKPGHFDQLLPNWKKLHERSIYSKTLNGNEIKIHQYLYEKAGYNGFGGGPRFSWFLTKPGVLGCQG
jgi:SAM-dependent methyltransferase